MRKLLVPIALQLSLLGGVSAVVSLSAIPAAYAQEAGLADRRAMATYQEKIYPALLKAVQDAAGFEVPVEVKWDTLTLAGRADRFNEADYATNIFFTPLAQGLSKIATDDMGKQALKAKLKKIIIFYDAATAPSSAYGDGLKFDDGTLSINFTPDSNASDIEARAEAIKKLLETKL